MALQAFLQFLTLFKPLPLPLLLLLPFLLGK
jgi:hypothetical protein